MTHFLSPKACFVTMTSVAALMALGLSGTSAQAACVKAGKYVTCSGVSAPYSDAVPDITVEVEDTAKVNAGGGSAIALSGGGGTVINAGEILAGIGFNGVFINKGGKIQNVKDSVFKNGVISGGTGAAIIAQNGKVVIENDGVINNAKKDAIIIELGSHNSEITNNGTITAFGIGISLKGVDNTTILNESGAEITADTGVWVDSAIRQQTTIINDGDLKGTRFAIDGSDGNEIITNNGSIRGAVRLGNGDNTLHNHWAIYNGDVTGGSGIDRVVNDGSISGKLGLGAGNNVVKNIGTGMIVQGITTLGGNDIIENHAVIGTVMSPVVIDLGNGDNTLTNGATGVIHGEVIMGAGDDVVVNHGAIAIDLMNRNVNLGEGNNKLTNTGQWDPLNGIRKGISGSVLAGAGNDEIINSGAIAGNVNVGNGSNTVNNTGLVGASILGGLGGFHTVTNGVDGKVFGSVDLGNNVDTLTNNGEISRDVLMRDGNDTVVNTGVIGGSIDLGVGNDNLTLNMNMRVGGIIDGGVGTDTLTLGGGVANQSQTFSNTVNNIESLQKVGAGRWELDRDYNFSNAVGVRAGELHIATNRTVTTAGVVVGTGGTFSGLGRVQGSVNVLVTGILRPGNGTTGTGTLTVTGNVTVDAGSFVEVSVGPGALQSQLAVGGSVNLGGNGTLTVAVAPGLYRNGASYDVITAGVAVNGQFGLTTLPAGTKFTKFKVNYTVPRVVQVLVEKINYATIGNTYNQRQAGDGLFRGMAGSGAGSDMETVAEAFERLGANDDAYRAALDSLSGEAWAAMGEVRSGVTRNFRALGMGRIDGNLEGVGVWGNVLQGQEDVKGDGNGERIRGDVRGLVGGVEYGFGGGKVGVMVGYGQGGLKLGARGEGEVKLMMGGVYGGWNFGGIEVSGGVSYASGKQKVTRSIVGSWLPNQRNMRGSEQVREFGMDVGVGYGINLGMIKVTPEVGLEMARVYEQGFEEKGGNSVSLSGEKEKGWEGRGHVRVEVSAVFQAGLVSFEPYVKGGYERVLVGKGYQDRDVSFQQPGTAFNVRSTDGGKNIYTGGGGLNVGFGPVTVGVGYQQSIGGKRDERTFQGSLGIRW